MPSLKTTYSILFEQFTPKDTTKIAGKVEAGQKAIEADKQRKFGILLGKKSKEADTQTSLKKYMEKYGVLPELGQYLFGSSFTPEKSDAWHSEAQQAFQRMNQEYKYFGQNSTKQAQVLYLDCYKFCVYQAQFVEYNDQPAHEVEQRAYNTLVFFGSVWSGEEEVKKSEEKTDDNIEIISTIESLEKFINRYMHGSQSPIHDLFIHRLPIHDPDNHYFKFQVWRAKILETLGYEAIQHFSDAPKIASYITEQRAKGEGVDDVDDYNIPTNIKSFHAILMKCAYSRISENPDLARLFKFYSTPEDTYNKTLELMKDGTLKVDATRKLLAPKTVDYIPDVTIPIADGKYYLVKLPSHDLRSLILGQITNCCQSIGSPGEDCTIDGVNLSHNGFYVFIKAGQGFNPSNIDWDNFEIKDGRETGNKIIGQSYAWIGLDNSLTFDSIEVLESFKAELDIQNTLERFGNEILKENPNISRVMLGTSGGTSMVFEANNYKANKSNAPSYPKEGSSYDAYEQFEVYASDSLNQARSDLAEIMHVAQDHIVSVEHAKLIMSLGVPYLKLLSGSYHYNKWTSFAITSTCQDALQLLARHKVLGMLQIKEPILYKAIFEDSRIKKTLSKKYIKFEDIIVAGTEQYQLLVSEAAFALYALGVTGKDLLGANSEITERNILKNLAEKICLEPVTNLAYIDSLETGVVQRLVNYSAIDLYKKYKAKVVDLASISSEVFEALSSYYAIEAYKTRQVTFNDLKNLEEERIKILTGYRLIDAYKTCKVSFQDLKDLPLGIIEALTGYQAIEAYKSDLLQISDLVGLNEKQIKALTSYIALALYRTGQANVAALKEINPTFLFVLTSSESGWMYNKQVSFADLAALDTDKATALISNNAITAYGTSKVTFKDLRDLSLDQIKLLISQEACSVYQHINNIKFLDLIDVDHPFIKMLNSYEAIEVLNKGYVTISDLKNCDERKIKVLTSPYAREVYKMEEASFHNLNDLSIPFIKALTEGAYYAYQSGFVHFADLKDLSKEQITSLTSREAINAYKVGRIIIADLKNLSPEQIISLTDYPAITAYKLGINVESLVGATAEIINQNILKNLAILLFKDSRETFEYIEGLDADKIRDLILDNIEEGYNDYKMPIQTLKNLPLESDNDARKLEALLSRFAFEIYKAGYYTAADLSTLPLEQILALTSWEALGTYRTETFTPEDFEYLKSAPVEQVELLTNRKCEEAYQSKLITFGVLKHLAPWQIPLVTSHSAIAAYRTGKVTIEDFSNLTLEQIALTDYPAITAYKFGINIRNIIGATGEVINQNILKNLAHLFFSTSEKTFEYIESLSTDKIKDLIQTINTAYNYVKIPVHTFKDFSITDNNDTEKLNALFSIFAIRIYRGNYYTASDLKDLSLEKILALTSSNALHTYEEAQLTPEDFEYLKSIPAERIEFLTNLCYLCSVLHIKFQDLKHLEPWQIQAINSHKVILAYESGHITWADLLSLTPEGINELPYFKALEIKKMENCRGLDAETIEALYSREAELAYSSGYVQPSDLRNCTPEQIKFLTSYKMIDIYKTTLFKPSDFVGRSLEDIKFLTSYNMMRIYETTSFKPSDLVGRSLEDIKFLTSYNMMRIYETTSFKPSDFTGCSAEQIKLLTSYKMMEIYKTTLAKPADFAGCSIEQIEALTGYSSIEAYKTGSIKVSDLIGLSVEQIKAVTSHWALKAYKSNLITLDDLRLCNKEQIDILTSDKLLEVYQTRKIKPSDIAALPPDKILAVVSCFAMMAYSTGNVTVHELSQYNIDQIYALISPDAIRCYQLGYGVYDLLGETSDEINSNIQEVASRVDFTENILEADSSHEEKSEPISVHIVGEAKFPEID